MKSLLLFIVLIATNSWAEKIKLPISLIGAEEDPKAKIGNFYVYEIEGKISPQILKPNFFNVRDSIEKFVQSQTWCFLHQDENNFLKLIDPENTTMYSKEGSFIKKEFKRLKDIKEERLESYFKYKEGYIVNVSYMHNGQRINMPFYVVKKGKNFYLTSFTLKQDDIYAHNVALYLTYPHFKIEKPAFKIETSDSSIKIQGKTPYSIVTFFTREDGKWQFVTNTLDNETSDNFLKDEDKREHFFQTTISKTLMKDPEKYEILILNSEFPLGEASIKDYPEGQIKK